MSHGSQWMVLACVCGLVLSAAACSSGSDGTVAGPLTAAAAETILGGPDGVIPSIVDFTSGIGLLLDTIPQSPAPADTRGVGGCTNLPGIVGANLCLVPADGQLCQISASEAELRFTACNALEIRTTLDGTVSSTRIASDTFLLDFDLTIDGSQTIRDLVTFKLGGACPLAEFAGLTLASGGVTAAYDSGSLESCSETESDGDFQVTVDASGFERFFADVTASGASADATVRDAEGPLYTCAFDVPGRSGQCMDTASTP